MASSYKGAKMGSLKAHVVKSKGMPGVTADKTGTPGSKQSSKDLHEKFKAVRHHA